MAIPIRRAVAQGGKVQPFGDQKKNMQALRDGCAVGTKATAISNGSMASQSSSNAPST
jgi:hypothetical protein